MIIKTDTLDPLEKNHSAVSVSIGIFCEASEVLAWNNGTRILLHSMFSLDVGGRVYLPLHGSKPDP